MNTITKWQLKAKKDNNEDFQLIDVREDYEFEDYSIGGINIPLDTVLNSIDIIEKDKPVIFCCKTGKRSKAISLAIAKKMNLTNTYSLVGGVMGYQEEIGS